MHNYTDETISEVQNCGFDYTGRSKELITLFNRMSITNSYGVTLDSKFDVSCNSMFSMTDTYMFSLFNSEITYDYEAGEGLQVKDLDDFEDFWNNYNRFTRLRSRRAGYLNTDSDTF